MSRQKNTPPQGLPGGLFQTLFTLANGLNCRKRPGTLILLMALLVITYLLYEHRRDLSSGALFASGTPQIDRQMIGPEITRLMADTGAISASVWSVNLERNLRKSIYVRIGDKELTNLFDTGDLVLRPESQLTKQFIILLDKKTNCWELIAVTQVGRAGREAGVTWVCAATIPPGAGTVIGTLAVGFPARPASEDYIRLRISQAAQRIMKPSNPG